MAPSHCRHLFTRCGKRNQNTHSAPTYTKQIARSAKQRSTQAIACCDTTSRRVGHCCRYKHRRDHQSPTSTANDLTKRSPKFHPVLIDRVIAMSQIRNLRRNSRELNELHFFAQPLRYKNNKSPDKTHVFEFHPSNG